VNRPGFAGGSGDCSESLAGLGLSGISCQGGLVDIYPAIARMKRSPKMTGTGPWPSPIHEAVSSTLFPFGSDRPFGGASPPAALFYASRDRSGDHPERHLKRTPPRRAAL